MTVIMVSVSTAVRISFCPKIRIMPDTPAYNVGSGHSFCLRILSFWLDFVSLDLGGVLTTSTADKVVVDE